MQEPDTTDEALMRRFRDSFDSSAFDALLNRHHARAVRVSRRLLGEATAEDAVQEAFLRVVRERHAFDPARSFSGWFYTILRHVCLDTLRQRQRRQRREETLARELPSTETAAPVPSAISVTEILQPLPPAEREILTLRIVEGRAFDEVAVRLGCSVEAAKKRAQRALQALRALHRD